MLSIILQTERLLLRPPVAADISHFVPLLNDFDVSKNLAVVPHPYTEDDGCAFVVKTSNARVQGADYVFSILRKKDGVLIGVRGVHPEFDLSFGYWIGKPYWGQGYATEAAQRLARFAFDELSAKQLTAGWFHDNPASGRVLEKIGCKANGEDEKNCLSRGTNVFCHKVVLRRADFERLG